MLSIDKKQGLTGGCLLSGWHHAGGWVCLTEHATDLTRHIWCYSCKCQLLISKPKDEIKWILNICAWINWEYGSKDVSMKPWSCFQCVLDIPLVICPVLTYTVVGELKGIVPFSSHTSETADWVTFLRWLLILRSCLTDKIEVTQQLKFGQENILRSIYEYKIYSPFAFSFSFKWPLAVLVRIG